MIQALRLLFLALAIIFTHGTRKKQQVSNRNSEDMVRHYGLFCPILLERGCFIEEEKHISQAEVHLTWLMVEMDLC